MGQPIHVLKPEFFLLVDLHDFFFQFRVRGRIKNNTLKMTRQLVILRAFLNIFRTNSKKTSKKLDRTITFNSVTLKNSQKEPQKYITIFNEKNYVWSQWIK